MDQFLKRPGHNELDNAFHRMFELSRTTPAPGLGQRLDRLARLRAVIADNEARFEAAISADFGHRCATETAIAETLLVLGEIKHAARHLKSWMAPQRVSLRRQDRAAAKDAAIHVVVLEKCANAVTPARCHNESGCLWRAEAPSQGRQPAGRDNKK
jgi:hypothetical protein